MNMIIIRRESGVAADVNSTVPVHEVVVGHAVFEGGESFERRMEKAVLAMTPEQHIRPDEVHAIVSSLALECVRPADRQTSDASKHTAAA